MDIIYTNNTYKRLYIFIWLASVDIYNDEENHQSASKYIKFRKHLKRLITTIPKNISLNIHGILTNYYTRWLRNHNITFTEINNSDEATYRKLLMDIVNKYIGYRCNAKD